MYSSNNKSTKEMLLVVKLTNAPVAIDGKADLYGNLTLIDQPFYNATDVSVARNVDNNEFLNRRNELRKEHEDKIRLEEKKKSILEKIG